MVHDLWNTKLEWFSLGKTSWTSRDSPVFVAHTIRDDDVRYVGDDGLGRGVHDIEGSPIIGLLKIVARAHPGTRMSEVAWAASMEKVHD